MTPAEKEIRQLLLQYFKGDEDKVKEWLYTDNPLLGNICPMTMIVIGNEERLLRCMKDWMEGKMA